MAWPFRRFSSDWRHERHDEGLRSQVWALIDEILNAVLFLLIGLEAVVLADRVGLLALGLLTILLVLAARAVSVGAPLMFWGRLLRPGVSGDDLGGYAGAYPSPWRCRCRPAR